MEENLQIIIVSVSFFVLIFVILLIKFSIKKKRREAIKNIAIEKGWKYEKKVPLPKPMIRVGDPFNVIMGNLNSEAEGMLYDQEFYNSKYATTNTDFQINFKNINLPDFRLAKENFLSKALEKAGLKDIDFDESPDFSNIYLLAGHDEEAIRKTFTETIRNYFISNQDWATEGWALQCEKNTITGSRNKKIKPDEWSNIIDKMHEIADLFTNL